jgi:hypothetical protein
MRTSRGWQSPLIMKSPLRTVADALVITAVAALGFAFAASTEWPRWLHIITLLPAAYLVSRLSTDPVLAWWKPVGFVCLFILLHFLSSGPEATRLLPRGATLPIGIIVVLLCSRLERYFARR